MSMTMSVSQNHSEPDLLKVLQERFLLPSFRPHQEAIIRDTLAGRDVVALLPTGAGKSLCYQLPGVLGEGLTVVIYPLLALINDQAMLMRGMGLGVVIYNGHTSRAEKASVVAQCRYQRVVVGARGRTVTETPLPWAFLLTTPETLCSDGELLKGLGDLASRGRLSRFVVDESHCIHSWADDFRPSYLGLSLLRERFPGVPIMAQTATAREITIREIVERLGLRDPVIHRGSYHRANLEYEVLPKDNRNEPFYDQLYGLVGRLCSQGDGKGASVPLGTLKIPSGIIYSFSRDSCHRIAEALVSRDRSGVLRGKVAVYHAGLNEVERHSVQTDWLEGKVAIIVATIAFGLGINKPDVRFVIHCTLPTSLEAYSQETGRAGRDGQQSSCYLYYSKRDVGFLRRILKEHQVRSLERVRQWAEEDRSCRLYYLLSYLDEPAESLARFRTPCGQCDNCWGLGTRVQRKAAPPDDLWIDSDGNDGETVVIPL